MSSTARRSAAKVAAYRKRQRCGLAVMRVTVPQYDVIEALLETGRLSIDDALHRDRVEHAIGQLVVDWSRRWGR